MLPKVEIVTERKVSYRKKETEGQKSACFKSIARSDKNLVNLYLNKDTTVPGFEKYSANVEHFKS